MTTPPPNKRDLETALSRLLTACIWLAGAVGALGIILYLPAHRGARADLSAFTVQPDHLREPAEIARHAAKLDSAAVLQLAVLMLILTPVLRVVFSLVMFARQRDWLYVVIAGVVLAALGAGLLSR